MPKHPQLHAQSNYKLPGGKIMALSIIVFLRLYFAYYLLIQARIGVIFASLWFVIITLFYFKQRHKLKQNKL